MTDPHAAPVAGPEAHAHEEHISDKTFMKIFGILLVGTTISFGVNQLIGPEKAVMNFIIILGVAVLKAALVVLFFMHLKIDWRKVFVFIMPTMILASVVLLVLWPDIVLAWTRYYPQP